MTFDAGNILLKRGLVTHEQELKLLLIDEKIDVAFIAETDTKALCKELTNIINFTLILWRCKRSYSYRT